MPKETYTQDPKRLNQTVEFLKILNEERGTDPEQIAADLKMTKGAAWRRIYDFCTLYTETVDNEDFPAGLQLFYNRFIEQEEDKLSEEEILGLKYLINKYYTNLKSNKVSKESNREMTTNKVTYNDPRVQQQRPQVEEDDGVEKLPPLDTHEALLRNICQNNPYIQNTKIDKFINIFRMNKSVYLRQPQKLLGLLKGAFGPGPAEMVYTAYYDAAPQLVTEGGLFGQSQSNGLPPGLSQGGPNMEQYMQQKMMEEQQEDARERREDRRMRRMQEMNQQMVQTFMTAMLQKTMEAQTPMSPNNIMMQRGADGQYKISEEYTPEGKVARRDMLPVASVTPSIGNTPETSAMKAVVDNLASQNKFFMEKAFSQDSTTIIKDIVVPLMNTAKPELNPLDNVIKMKSAFPEVFAGRTNQQTTPELIREELGAKLALMHEEFLMKDKEHEWTMESQEKRAASENGNKLLDNVSEIVQKVFGPAVENLSQGYAQGLVARQHQATNFELQEREKAYHAAKQREEIMRQREAMARQQQREEDEYIPRGAPLRPQQPQQANMSQNQYNEKQFFNLDENQLNVLEQEYNKRVIDMESFGNALRTAKAQRRLIGRQQGIAAEDNATADYNSMGNIVGGQAPKPAKAAPVGIANTGSFTDDTGTNPGAVALESQEEDNGEEAETELSGQEVQSDQNQMGETEPEDLEPSEIAANLEAEELEEEEDEEGTELEADTGEEDSSQSGIDFKASVNPEQNHADDRNPS